MKTEILTDFFNLTSFVFWIFLFYKKTGNESVLNNSNIITIIIYLIGRVTNNKKLLAIYHVLLALHLIAIAFFSKDKELLLYLTTTIFFIITSRKILNGCAIRKIEEKNSSISKNEFTKKLNWDYLFPLIGLIGNLKIHYYDL